MSFNFNEDRLTFDEAIENCEDITRQESCSPRTQNFSQLGEQFEWFKFDESVFNPLFDISRVNTLLGIDLNTIPDPCRGCPNHPANGDSGICLCTLGLPEITC